MRPHACAMFLTTSNPHFPRDGTGDEQLVRRFSPRSSPQSPYSAERSFPALRFRPKRECLKASSHNVGRVKIIEAELEDASALPFRVD